MLFGGFSAFAQPLSGTYTIGGTTPSYASLSAAITALNNNGVSGPVIFNIRSGSYSGSTWVGTINTIAGASSTNTVTFQPESGVGTVTISTTGSSTSNNFIFKLDNANYVTIKDLTLSNTGTTYGTDVQFAGSASYNTVDNCTLTGNTSTSTSMYKSRVFASGNTGGYNTVSNNTFPAGCSWGVYYSSNSSSRPTNNVISGNTMVPYYGSVYAYYNNDIKIRNNTITKTNSGGFMGIYMYDCDSAVEITGNSQIVSSVSSTYYGIYKYYCDGRPGRNQKVGNNTITATTSSTAYPTYFYFDTYDSVYNNNFTTTASSTIYTYFYYPNDLTIRNNNFTATTTTSSTCYPIYIYGYYSGTQYGNNITFDNNTVTGTGGGSVQNMFYYCSDYKWTNNTLRAVSTGSGTVYGMYDYSTNIFYNGEVSGNKIFAKSNTGTTYGLSTSYHVGDIKIFNNAVAAQTSGTCYAFYCYYNYGGGYDIYNNTFHSLGTGSTNYGAYTYISLAGCYLNMHNNVVSKVNAGSTPLVYMYTPTYMTADYNNWYTPSGDIFRSVTGPGGSYTSISAWRAATGLDKNSLSFAPAFVSAATGDLTPDASNSNCWSMHGRGIHMPGNDKDINGNPRHVIPSTGVPDLGAYEFTPNTGVTPPLCAVTPAAPVAGGTQVYTFGGDTVATITWDAAATVPATSPDCRQYSGVVPPGLSSINATNMYFYTDISSGTSADYEANIYYKDPWIGTIASDLVLHLAKKDGANPWVGYPITISGVNAVRNFIYSPASPKLNTYGLYTGIDVANNAGTDAIVTPSGFFCPGTYPVTVRIKNNGNNALNSVKIHWQMNGGPVTTINYTTTIPVNNGTPNSNAANIFLTNATFGASAHVFKVWTSDPNGVADVIPADDTINVSIRAALSGVYTVGGTAPDFPSVEAAVDDLNQYGICGPVTFNIRPGTYTSTKSLVIGKIVGADAANRVTFQSENGLASGVVIRWAGATSTSNAHTINLANAGYIAIKNVSLLCASPSYGYALGITGSSHNDSIVGCVLTTNVTTSSYFGALYGSLNDTCSNLVIQNNVLTGGYYGLYLNGTQSKFTRFPVIEGNTINNSYLSAYIYYAANLKFNGNTINSNSTTYYGVYIYNYGTTPANSWIEANNNKVTGHYQGYAFMIQYPNGYPLSVAPTTRSSIKNNSIAGVAGGSLYYGMYLYYPSNADIVNNSVNITNAYSSCYGVGLYFSSSPYNNNVVKNNAMINTGGGYALYLYTPSGYNNVVDYNNIYGTGSTPIYEAYYTGSHANFGNYRTAVASRGWDQNSISYAPGFTSATDLTPDPTNPASWSLNGRGEQLASSPLDINGNSRPTTLAAGVPDIGAYEFEPTVAPPAAIATPATAAPGVTQVFTFGYQKVATVKWNTALALTTPLTVRQYSGRIPPANFTTISGGTHQYFYTDFTPSAIGTTYDFDLTLNYMDIWMGSIASESGMKLAHKHASTPWISYNAANSSTNATSNTIQANGVTTFGTFTGIPDGVNFSALLVPAGGKSYICSGDTVLLLASPVSGGSTTYTYEWFRNGVLIPGAATNTYPATLGGDYTVKITGTQSSTSIPVGVVVTAPPMATVGASGALTYCNGSQLQLSASSPSGILSYQWQLNGTNIPGATSQTYDVTTAGTYNLIVTNIGCSDTSTATIVNAGPINVNLGADITGCEIKNQPYILDAGYPGAKYTWSTGDTTQTIQIYKGSGTYSVFVDAGPNCQGSDAINVTINPLPTATGISYIRTNNTYIFNVAGAQNVTKVLWIFSDGTTHTANTVTKTYDGNLVAKLVIYNDCGTDTLQSVQWATNVTTAENVELEASLYPNPASEQTLLSVTGAKIEDVTILNSLGQVVYRTMLTEKAGKVELPVSSFASGRYIVRATTTEGIISKPLNIQR